MKRILRTFAALLVGVLLIALVSCSTPEERYERQKAAYDGIIAEYTALLTAKQNGEELTPPVTDGMSEGEAAIAEALYGIVDAYPDADAVASMGYGFKDMDGNGTPELLLMSKSCVLWAVFTVSDQTPILLEALYGSGTMFLMAGENRLVTKQNVTTDNEREVTIRYCHVDGDQMVSDTVYGSVYDTETYEYLEYFQMVDGQRTPLDQEAFDALQEEFNQIYGYGAEYQWVTKPIAPRRFYPLAEETETPPPVDFSTYEAIKDSFKAMVALMPDGGKFLTGELDNCFTYDNDAEFETFNQLFYLAKLNSPDTGTFYATFPENGAMAYGYCEMDLNGDGGDELILMTDDYRIFSIFTTVEGKVVPLEGFLDFDLDWDLYGMDKEGRFYGMSIPDYGLGRDRAVFEITPEGRLVKTLHLREIWMSKDDGYFKLENDEQIRITEEEYNTLKAERFDKFTLSRDGSSGEIVRNCTDIVFTPFFERPKADHMPTDDYWVNISYGDQDRLYLKSVEADSVGFIWADFDGMGEKVGILVSDTAVLTDGKYVFEENGVKGYLEFGVYMTWIVVESSEDERILPRAYLYDFHETDD